MVIVVLVLQLLVFITNFILGISVFRANPKSRTNFLYAVFAIALAFWNLSLFMTIVGVWPQLIWSRLAFSFGVVMATALFYFSLVFPGPFRRRLWLDIVLGISTVILFILTLTKWMVTNIEVIQGYITGDFGPVIILFTVYVLFSFFGSIFVLFYKYRRSTGLARQQLFYVLVSSGFFVSTFLTTNLILPIFFGIFQFNNFGPVFSLPMIALIGYAIVRHQLMDIRVVIQRGVLYLITIIIVTAIYFLAVFALGEVFRKTTEIAPLISALIAAIVVVLGFPRFKDFFQRTTDKFFFRGEYNYYEILRNLSKTLSSTLDLGKLLNSIDEIIGGALKVNKILFLLQDKSGNLRVIQNRNFKIDKASVERELQDLVEASPRIINEIAVLQELNYEIKNMAQDDERIGPYKTIGNILGGIGAAVFIPIFSKNKLNAVLILGEKLSGDLFMQKDTELLNIFSHQAGVALENARLYEEVKEYSDQLEKKIEERTRELRRLYESHSRFLTDISHELQTPLAVLKGNVGLIKKENHKNHRNFKAMDNVEKIIDRMSRIISNLLSLMGADFGQQKLEKKAVRLDQLLQEIYEDCRILAQNKNVHFSLYTDDSMMILGDREKLRELFLNLVGNALKHTPAGREIKIDLYKENNQVKIAVRDTGHGISLEDLPHIFERFYRSSDKMRRIEGIGLGLAICKQIVESHGGTITVESKPGKGSKFIVSLPIYIEK